jgi:predicted RNase H-like HicB family nuclease
VADKTVEKILRYNAIFEPTANGRYVVTVPRLPGLVVEADNFEDGQKLAKDAIKKYLDVLQKEGKPIPEPFEKSFTTPIDVKFPVAPGIKINLWPALFALLIITLLAVGGYYLYQNKLFIFAPNGTQSSPTPSATPDLTVDWEVFNYSPSLSFKLPKEIELGYSNAGHYVYSAGLPGMTTFQISGADGPTESGQKETYSTLKEMINKNKQFDIKSYDLKGKEAIEFNTDKEINSGSDFYYLGGGTSSKMRGILAKMDDNSGLLIIHYQPKGTQLDSDFQKDDTLFNQIISTFNFSTKADISSWKTFTSTKIPELSFPAFSIKYPSNWEYSVDSGSGFANFKLTEKATGSTINVSQAATDGTMCIFKDSAPFEGPSDDLKTATYTEVTAGIGTFRRYKKAETDNTFGVCQKTKDNSWMKPTTIGHMNLGVTKDNESKIISEVDAILGTLKSVK